MENQLEPVYQHPLNQTQSNQQKSKSPFIIFLMIAIIVTISFLGSIFYFITRQQESTTLQSQFYTNNTTPTATTYLQKKSIEPQTKKIVVVNRTKEETVFYTFDPNSKEKKDFLRLKSTIMVSESKISPDGKKLYYLFSSSPFDIPGKVTIVDNQGSKKEAEFAKNSLWTVENKCFWSPDSSKLACMLIEREAKNGAGTGRAKISVYDHDTENISDVLISDQIAPPKRTMDLTTLSGWIGNNNLLIVQKDSNFLQDIQPSDFYSLNISTKKTTKEFSHTYGNVLSLIIAPSGRQIFFQSFGGVNEDRFIQYNLDSKQETILASTRDVLGTTNPVISENGSKVIFTTYVFPQTSVASDTSKPETLKEAGKTEIHIYDPATNGERKVRVDPIGFVESLLPDDKTLIVNKIPDGSVILDSETQSIEKLDGQYVGLGYF